MKIRTPCNLFTGQVKERVTGTFINTSTIEMVKMTNL